MRKAVLIALTVIISIASTGCTNILNTGRREIDDIEFVRAIAIDKSLTNSDLIRLTISTETIQSAAGDKTNQKKSLTVSSEGRTVFEAVRNFSKYLGKSPFFGHLEFIAIGEDAAREGINKYLDFFTRDREIRLNLKVFLLKDERAENLMEMGSSKGRFVFDKLGGLVKNRGSQSVTNLVDLIEIMFILDMKYLSLYMPCIEMADVMKGNDMNENTRDIKMGGFAIFDGDKLVAHLDENMGRGLNWLRDKIISGIIVVNSEAGNNISLEIIESKTKIIPEIKNGELSIRVKVEMASNIGELQTTENVFNENSFRYMELQQEQIIKNEIESVINFAQKDVALDFFSIGHRVFHKYPIIWEDKYKSQWRTIFPKIKFYVDVKSKVRRAYDVEQSNASETGEG